MSSPGLWLPFPRCLGGERDGSLSVIYSGGLQLFMSRGSTPTLEQLDEQLDAELSRVQKLTEDFQDWATEQRTKIEAHRQKQLRGGEVSVTEYNAIVLALQNIESQPPETIEYLLRTFDLLAHT
jgi:hypothetical protein